MEDQSNQTQMYSKWKTGKHVVLHEDQGAVVKKYELRGNSFVEQNLYSLNFNSKGFVMHKFVILHVITSK